MRANKQNRKSIVTPIRRAIRAQDEAAPIAPGAIGQAAVAAAALRQLENCAREIEQYVEASQMETLLDRIVSEIDRVNPDKPGVLRLRRD